MQRLNNSSLHPVSCSTTILARIPAACIGLLLFLFPALSSIFKTASQKHQAAAKAVVSLVDKILIFPGRISHTRLFPKHHSFSYSYLMVGVPIHSNNKGTRLLSVDDERAWWKRGWLRVEAADHLGRGGNERGIHGKLRWYLESKGVDPAEYPNVYLITSPRFLNYKFSPASFWYLYSAEMELKAMITEVNNTFDERRMYFLPFNMNQPDSPDTNGCQSLDESLAQPYCPPTRHFKHVWPKDFHVSPFNSRKGTYALSACDPYLSSPTIEGGKFKPDVDIKATLLSSKGRPKMTARLWSTSAPLDPATMSILDSMVFVSLWWWVGLMTYPRILAEAIKLAFRRKLSIWYRPEVKQGTVARKATTEEIFLSHIFQKYLTYQIARIETPLEIRYFSIDTEARHWTFHTGNGVQSTTVQAPRKAPVTTKQFHVLTPAFYSRLASYQTLDAALTAEVLSPDAEENRTAQVSDTGDLCALLAQASLSDHYIPAYQDRHHSETLLDCMTWRLVSYLRRHPQAGSYPSPGHPQTRRGKPTHDALNPPAFSSAKGALIPGAMSFLDNFVRHACSEDERREYQKTVLRLFLADRAAMGSVALLRWYGLMFRVLAVVVAVWVVRGGAPTDGEQMLGSWVVAGAGIIFLVGW